MLGMKFLHLQSEISGPVDGLSVDASGRSMVRIGDHWFFVDECVSLKA